MSRPAELALDRFALVRTHKGKKSFDRFVADVGSPRRPRPRWMACAASSSRGHRWWSLADVLIAERLGSVLDLP